MLVLDYNQEYHMIHHHGMHRARLSDTGRRELLDMVSQHLDILGSDKHTWKQRFQDLWSGADYINRPLYEILTLYRNPTVTYRQLRWCYSFAARCSHIKGHKPNFPGWLLPCLQEFQDLENTTLSQPSTEIDPCFI